VSVWLAAATALLLGLMPLGLVIIRRPLLEALVALELAGVLNTLVLLVLAEAFNRPAFMDLALVLALLSLAGGLVFARMVERWV
jgi:multicomponent Na+:H+ antiporter subunit F